MGLFKILFVKRENYYQNFVNSSQIGFYKWVSRKACEH